MMKILVIIFVWNFKSLTNGLEAGDAETAEEPKFELEEDPKTTPFWWRNERSKFADGFSIPFLQYSKSIVLI